MEQPPGYVQKGKEKLVCKLKKSLYGLKQSPRCWNEKLTQHVKSLGFEESGADPCIFTRKKNQKVEIIAIYVDDLIAITETDEEMRRLKKSLTSIFKMKDLGELYYCIGINFYRTKDSLYMSQSQYIHRLLEKYGLSDANTVATPMDSNVKLVEDDGYSKTVDSILYQSMVGSILHLARATRPDISRNSLFWGFIHSSSLGLLVMVVYNFSIISALSKISFYWQNSCYCHCDDIVWT